MVTAPAMALSTSPMFCATAPDLSVACSSSLAIASVVSLAVRTGVPFDHQRRQPFLRSPHMVGHDGDGVIEPDDLLYALNRLGRRVVDALHTTAENR